MRIGPLGDLGMVYGLILLSVVWWRGYLQWPMQVPGGSQSDAATWRSRRRAKAKSDDPVQVFLKWWSERGWTLGLGVPEP